MPVLVAVVVVAVVGGIWASLVEPPPRTALAPGPTANVHARSLTDPPSAAAEPSGAGWSSAAEAMEPSPVLPVSLVGSEWERIPTRRHVVALTFDAGANADAVPAILATLRARRVPATFFLTGEWARRYPNRAARISKRYPVGNHSDSHPDFTGLTNVQIRRQLRRASSSINAVGGGDPRPLFRFPFGARNDHTIRQVNLLGYGSIRWTVDSLGWKGTSGGMTARLVVRRVVGSLQPGAIVLMHVGSNPDDGSMLDARALSRVIDAATARGYRFVTLRRALAW